MPVRSRVDLEGPAIVFVTTTVVEWLPVFRSPRSAVIVVNQLGQALVHFGISCIAFVLMPHHLHLLAGLPDYRVLPKFMQSFKILTSKRIRQLAIAPLDNRAVSKGRFQLGKPRYDDLVILTQEQLEVKMRYIHENPVRAGLVENPEDWLYSSAAAWLYRRPSPIPIDMTFGWLGCGPAR